jgi:hypothetical protein
MKFYSICFMLCFNALLAFAGPVNGEATPSPLAGVVTVDLFESSTCPHCLKAGEFFKKLTQKSPWLRVNSHLINEDKAELALFFEKLKQFHSDDFSVPSIMFCDSRWVGFESAETTGKMLLLALSFCHTQLIKDGAITAATKNTLRQWSTSAGMANRIQLSKPPSPFLRVIVSPLAEVFTPCSLFSLLVFLSFVWIFPERRFVMVCLGGLFILCLAVLHTAQYVYTDLYQRWMLSYLMWFSWATAALLLWFLTVYIQSRRQQLNMQRAIRLAFPALVCTIIAVYGCQQICDFSVGAIFQQWLHSQSTTPSAYFFYQLSYVSLYVLPLLLLLAFYQLFGVRPARLLMVTACLILLIIALLLIVYSIGFSRMSFSYVTILASVIIGWQLVRKS